MLFESFHQNNDLDISEIYTNIGNFEFVNVNKSTLKFLKKEGIKWVILYDKNYNFICKVNISKLMEMVEKNEITI